MDLLALRYFQAVARCENVSRAAQELRVAQPSVSRTIARLEADLGAPLFRREGRRVRLNRPGAAFLARVDRALRELDDARREIADAAGLEHGTVVVASETVLTVAALVQRFRAAHPGVDVRLHQSPAGRMADQLRAGVVDLCFASQPVAGVALDGIDLADEDVLLAVPRGHRLAGRRSVAVGELAGEPFVTLYPGHWQRAVADALLADAGGEPVLVAQSDEPAATLELVAGGLGVGLVPAVGAAAWPDPRLTYLRIDHPAARRALRLVWRRDAYLPAAAAALRDLAVEHLASTAAAGS